MYTTKSSFINIGLCQTNKDIVTIIYLKEIHSKEENNNIILKLEGTPLFIEKMLFFYIYRLSLPINRLKYSFKK